jgi:hypothetical protein
MITRENMTTGGAVAIYDKPLAPARRKYKDFNVPPDTFRKFATGRNKFERWSKYLNLQDENQKAVYDYAKKNRDATIVLRCSDTGALRAIRRKASNE